jgi:ParB family chromosome partitioning protein
LIPDSALGGDAPRDEARGALRVIAIEEIRPNPEQPRSVFEPGALESLTESIRLHGVITPILVRRSEGRYVLVAGERRLRAAGLAGLKEVPAVVRDAPTGRTQLELALVENLQREDLDPVEAARGYDRLAREYKLTQDEVARAVGKDRTTITNAVRLLKLPDWVLAAVRDGRLSAGHARALVPLADLEGEMRAVVAKILAQQLSVRATERLVREACAKPKEVRKAEQEKRERTLEYAESVISEALHTDVRIKVRADGGGQVAVHFHDREELERLIHLLRRPA